MQLLEQAIDEQNESDLTVDCLTLREILEMHNSVDVEKTVSISLTLD